MSGRRRGAGGDREVPAGDPAVPRRRSLAAPIRLWQAARVSPEPDSGPFDLAIEVRPDDIDALGHVNNVVYLRWVQEAAVAHWDALTTDAMKAEAMWIVVRHEIDYRRPAGPGDRIVARTWVGAATRSTFERHTEIRHADDGALLARARTVWVPVDPATGRPKLVSEEVRRRFSVRRTD